MAEDCCACRWSQLEIRILHWRGEDGVRSYNIIMNEISSPQREVTLRFLTQAVELNFIGNIHGGAVMKWIDEAGYICAAGWCGRDAVTVYVGGIRFYEPIHAGDLVEVRARLLYTGNTSMHIAVDVSAGDPRSRSFRKTTHCIIVYVAIDENGKPIPVPKWQPQTTEDRELEAYALRLMALRKDIEREMQSHLP
jgi:acyl-CoA hydrolase